MNITFISDTHNKHDQVEFGSGDILVHCGDITEHGDLEQLQDFADCISNLDFSKKIVVAGNHDFCFENEDCQAAEKILADAGIIYLNDSGVEVFGIKFWGSPIQPEFFDWAFNRKRGADIRKHWKLIPEGIDVLITHGPPFGILDQTRRAEHVGCEELKARVEQLKPKIHAFGHIHEGYGMCTIDGTIYVNACSLDGGYSYKNRPIKINLA